MAQKAIHVNLAPTDPKNIAAGDDAAILSGIIGSALASSSGILAFGERLNLSKVTDNSVKVSSGIYLNQGHAVRVTSDEVLTVLSGTQGKQRIDLVVSEYRKGAERDTHVIKTIQGSLFDTDPEAPSLQAEDLHGAGTVRQEEIGRIVFNGTSIASVAKTAKTISGLVELADSIADHDTKYLSKTGKAADSDKLDGKDSTEFATKAQGTKADEALPKSGGTMTGGIYMQSNQIGTDSDPENSRHLTRKNYVDTEVAKKVDKTLVLTDDVLTIANDLPANEFKVIASASSYQFSDKSANAVFFLISRWAQRYVIAHRTDNSIMINTKLTATSDWSGWQLVGSNLYGTSVPSSLQPGQIFVQI